MNGSQGVAERQQTLKGSMEWSHDLLDENERILLRRLGVFQDGATLDGAQGACGFDGLDEGSVRLGLRKPVEKSLLLVEHSGAAVRYGMLETVHEFAQMQLDASGEDEIMHRRHYDTFLSYMEGHLPLIDDQRDKWRTLVAHEYSNLRAALVWAFAQDDPELGRRLAVTLPWFWHMTGHGHEGIEFLQAAIRGDEGSTSGLQGRLLVGLALVADTTSPVGLEYDAAEAALRISSENSDTRTHCLALCLMAIGKIYLDIDEGEELAVAALAEARTIDDPFAIHGSGALLGITAVHRDNHERAHQLLRSAIDGFARIEERGVAATSYGYLAQSLLQQGNVNDARRTARQAVDVAEPLGDYHRRGWTLSVLASVEVCSGNIDRAFDLLRPMMHLVEASEKRLFVPGLSRVAGVLHLMSGRPKEAIEWFERDTEMGGGTEAISHLSTESLLGVAAAFREDEQLGRARAAVDAAFAAADTFRMPRLKADALHERARQCEADDWKAALEFLHEALAIRKAHGLKLGCLASLESLAISSIRLGRLGDGVRLLSAGRHSQEVLGVWLVRSDAAEAIESANLQLGDEKFEAEWALGATLGLDEAVEYAQRARGERGRPTTGWDSLSPTEQRVADLACDGFNNPEIATKLLMSRGTVKTHLSHIYEKVGVSNRTELAADRPAPR